MNHDPVKQAWQASVEIAGAPPIEEVRKSVNKFYRFIRWRNGSEYVACVIAIVTFTTYVFTLPHWLQKLGSALIVVATFFAGWQLHRRAGALPPDKAGTMPILEFSRLQMVRQRDAMRGLFWWYVLPFVPGLFLVSLGSAAAEAGETSALVMPPWQGWAFMLAMVAVLLAICWLNRYFANKLQRHIDNVDALIGEGR